METIMARQRTRPVTRSTSGLIYEYFVPSSEAVERLSSRQSNQQQARCQCGKSFKNMRGVKIHQGRTGCGKKEPPMQRSEVHAGKTKEDQSQEAHHSAQDLQAEEEPDPTEPVQERRQRIKWPALNDKKTWAQLDDELDTILEVALVGSAEHKAEAMSTITYSFCLERFGGEVKSQSKNKGRPNRRQTLVEKIRIELRQLRKRWKRSEESEKEGIKALRQVLQAQLSALRKAERRRRVKRQKEKRRAQFIANPYKFVSELLGGKKSGRLQCPQEELEKHLRETYSDKDREKPLGECRLLNEQPLPSVAFDLKEPTWAEISEIVRKARAKSAPGPSGLGYNIYKSCPKLRRRLLNIIKILWREEQYHQAGREQRDASSQRRKRPKI